MEKLCKHFLVTRFNLKVENWKLTKTGEEVLTAKWLKNRFELFLQYCFPSVKNQTNQEFIWLVFFDSSTPDDYKSKIAILSNEYSNFQPTYIDSIIFLRSTFIKLITEKISDQHDYIITTRLDNDDIIHRDFTSAIQKSFKPVNELVIDLVSGYQVTMNGGKKRIGLYQSVCNPFVSLVEQKENFGTVLSRMHSKWRFADAILSLKKQRLWIQLIHDDNKSNDTLSRLLRISKLEVKHQFGFNGNEYFEDNMSEVIFSNVKNRIHSFLSFVYHLINASK